MSIGLATHRHYDAVVSGAGSLLFNGTAAGQLNYGNTPTISIGTGDFTAEWWQYETDSNGAPRPWGIGPWSTTQLGVSLETGVLVWINGNSYSFGSYTSVKNTWVHWAIVRQSGSVKVYRNGTAINSGNSISIPSSISGSGYHLTLGGEGGTYASQTFGGNITNFRLNINAVYTSNFTVPTQPLTATGNTFCTS